MEGGGGVGRGAQGGKRGDNNEALKHKTYSYRTGPPYKKNVHPNSGVKEYVVER